MLKFFRDIFRHATSESITVYIYYYFIRHDHKLLNLIAKLFSINYHDKTKTTFVHFQYVKEKLSQN
jgi:hypothetical protein